MTISPKRDNLFLIQKFFLFFIPCVSHIRQLLPAYPVILWDERLTTAAADQILMESGVRREKRKNYVDKIAAVLILQGYLDYRHMKKDGTEEYGAGLGVND